MRRKEHEPIMTYMRQALYAIQHLHDGDDEAQHSVEDIMREEALRAIANAEVVGGDVVKLAQLALSTEGMDFNRWCA